MLCFFFGQFISNHCGCRSPTTLQIGKMHEYTVRRQMCCLPRASGVVVVVSPNVALMVILQQWLQVVRRTFLVG